MPENNQIIISVPSTFLPERIYAIDVLMATILQLDYHIKPSSQRNYEFTLPNGNRLILEDHFFTMAETDGYLDKRFIPSTVPFVKNSFTKGEDIPVIYGAEEPSIKQENGLIRCSIDIAASAFFMLTRWEEFVLDDRDEHDRFPATSALAVTHGFIDRPIVNEYAHLLWHMLQALGCRQQPALQDFSFILTHDVDALLKWLDWVHVLRTAAGDIIKRRQHKTAFSRVREYRSIQRQELKDPFDRYDWLMKLSESRNLQSHFYFMSNWNSQSSNDRHSAYPLKHLYARALFKKIKERGHVIGFHPGYGTIDNENVWAAQRDELENACGCTVTTGRQHYLRFKVPQTWQLWQDQGMHVDSTCGYSRREGFRCGTGHSFPVFNIQSRQKLKLLEQPLVFMDVCNFYDGGYDGKSFEHHHLFDIIRFARQFGTPVTLLFHNSVFAEPGFTELYQQILDR